MSGMHIIIAGQVLQLPEGFPHLRRVAAEVGSAHAATEQGIAGEQHVSGQIADASRGMPGGMQDGEVTLPDCDDFAVGAGGVCGDGGVRGMGDLPCEVRLSAFEHGGIIFMDIDLRTGGKAYCLHAADMVIVSVRQQDRTESELFFCEEIQQFVGGISDIDRRTDTVSAVDDMAIGCKFSKQQSFDFHNVPPESVKN